MTALAFNVSLVSSSKIEINDEDRSLEGAIRWDIINKINASSKLNV